ncbi:YggS family pyridoxal phosphate-dependent enzyme [Nocardioides yefusunii]|uniref:Pyridoxal phosphate homeostasis protein n=1 Tax=Nocardioides yefusunii TaxID=2500546 RepID=A0ABW1QVH5_9ACTN|nr:YggS family pyridoxal phosphate-dependent enzyme [Nocardioides yefusunii]
MTSREQFLSERLATVRARIDDAVSAAGRTDDVQLIVVTKYFPASDVRLLAGLGVTEVGENRHQEASEKSDECADLGLSWHYIGGLQSNKAAAVARYASVVQSVDRPKLVAPLDRGAGESGRVVDVLLQVSLDDPGADHRAGVLPADLSALADQVAAAEHLRLRGLMAVAPLGEEPARAFERLAQVRASFLSDHPQARVLSAGMSGDLEEAVAHGATHVRVGSAILGPRPPIL